MTICLILDDNTKISAHINPSTNFLALKNDKIKKNEIVNIFNLVEKILDKLEEIKQNIKKIILLSESKLYLFKKDEKIFIGDYYVKNLLEPEVSNDEDDPIKKFLKKSFKKYIVDDIKYLKLENEKNIKDGAIYIIKSDGKVYIYNKEDKSLYDDEYFEDILNNFNE